MKHSLLNCLNYVWWSKSSIKKWIIVCWTVRSMFSEQTLRPVKNGFYKEIVTKTDPKHSAMPPVPVLTATWGYKEIVTKTDQFNKAFCNSTSTVLTATWGYTETVTKTDQGSRFLCCFLNDLLAVHHVSLLCSFLFFLFLHVLFRQCCATVHTQSSQHGNTGDKALLAQLWWLFPSI